MNSSTPETVQLQFRKAEFEFVMQNSPWLGTLMQTHFFHALSIFIPASERYVSTIIQQSLPSLSNTPLQHHAKVFIQQEGRHAYLHKRCNDLLIQRYPRLAQFQDWQNTSLKGLDRLCTLAFRLSIPVSFEHITANISRNFLQNESHWTQGKSSQNIDFVKWHCLEELEHQGVCYDVYRHQYPQPKRIALSLILFWLPITMLCVYGIQGYLLFKDKKLNKPKHFRRFFRFALKNTPLFYQGVLKYFRKDYRPWNVQDEILYQATLKDLSVIQFKKETQTKKES